MQIVWTTFILILLPLAACSTMPVREHNAAIIKSIQRYITANSPAIGDAGQILFVINTDPSSPRAAILAMEKFSGEWQLAAGPIEGNIGRNGFAAPEEKREGDGKTPSGVFGLGTAFGYEPAARTRMPYRHVTANDFWIDDVDSPSYNSWVKGKPEGVSFERMKRDDDFYKYGIVIEYNTRPVLKGYGSAVFFHVWEGKGKPTSGCISMSEKSILDLLAWLDPARNPITVLGTEGRCFSSQ